MLNNFTNLYSGNKNNFKKYFLLIKLCKSIADPCCELKYYSYIYNEADTEILKNEAIERTVNILKNLKKEQFLKIDYSKFKKNLIYFIVKAEGYRFYGDKKYIKNLIKEAKNFNFFSKFINYLNQRFLAKKVTQNISIKKVCLLLPLTGKFKNIGFNALSGVLAGINFFTTNRNNYNIYIFDTNTDGDLYYELKKFINNKDINIILGPIQKKYLDDVIKIAIESDIPMINFVPGYDKKFYNSLVFNHNINLEDEMKFLAQVIEKELEQNSTVGVLYPENNFGKILKDYYSKFTNLNSIYVSYNSLTSDFKSPLMTLGDIKKKKKNRFFHRREINGILILDSIDKVLLMIPQLYFYDYKGIKIFGTHLFNNNKIFSLEKKFLKNIVYIDVVDYNSKESNYMYLKEYLHKYFNLNTNFYAILLYDTIKILDKLDFSSSKTIVNDLKDLKFDLLTGYTEFDRFGMCHKIFKVFNIQNGKLKVF